MKRITLFRPCIDLHDGKVKQIVGGTLSMNRNRRSELVENYVSNQPACYFAELFRRDGLMGGHVIQLGPGNEQAARKALAAYPEGLQIGGGINVENASHWLDAGASKVIVTSWLFDEAGILVPARLEKLIEEVGRDRIVIDLSCRRIQDGWKVAIHQWQTQTDLSISLSNLDWLSNYASEFLVHAVDVEGLCGGFDRDLAEYLGAWGKLPITYAGGVSSLADIAEIEKISNGKLDVTVGSALDIFGGNGVRYEDLVNWNRHSHEADPPITDLGDQLR
jgi:phosphoribosylformimino-5-aminoimidazole carboxamide ribotide isomerase